MIEVTKLNGVKVLLNPHLFEIVEETPDTVITLTIEREYTFYNLSLIFGSIQPVDFMITTFNDGKRLKRFKSKSITEKTIVYYDFIDTDKIEDRKSVV